MSPFNRNRNRLILFVPSYLITFLMSLQFNPTRLWSSTGPC